MRTFSLPDLGEGLTEAEIVAVLVREGDVIREDAPLLEVETDKAQVEIPSPMGGRVEKIHVAGQTVKVGAPMLRSPWAAEPAAARPRPDGPTRGERAIAQPATRRPPLCAAGGAPPQQRAPKSVAATPATRRLARG